MRGRPVAVGPIQNLFVLVAKLCYPSVNKTWLSKLCTLLGVVPDDNTKWALLKALVTHYLTIDLGAPPTPEEVLAILALEMAAGCGECTDVAMDTFMHVKMEPCWRQGKIKRTFKVRRIGTKGS